MAASGEPVKVGGTDPGWFNASLRPIEEAGMVKLKKAKLAAVAIEYQRRAVLWFRGECRYIPARLDATQKLRGPSGGKRHIEAVQWLL